jgi:hypothetical protein
VLAELADVLAGCEAAALELLLLLPPHLAIPSTTAIGATEPLLSCKMPPPIDWGRSPSRTRRRQRFFPSLRLLVQPPPGPGGISSLPPLGGWREEAFGGLDILVTSMGGRPRSVAVGWADDDWERALELVTLSVIRPCRAALPHLASAGAQSSTSPRPYSPAHPSAAFSSVGLPTTCSAKYLATEVAPEGVRVDNVLPGWIATGPWSPSPRQRPLRAGSAPRRSVPNRSPRSRWGFAAPRTSPMRLPSWRSSAPHI